MAETPKRAVISDFHFSFLAAGLIAAGIAVALLDRVESSGSARTPYHSSSPTRHEIVTKD